MLKDCSVSLSMDAPARPCSRIHAPAPPRRQKLGATPSAPHYRRMPAALAQAAPDADPSFAELIAARPQLSLHAMDGLLVEEVPLARIAAAVGTPTWVYSAGTLRRRTRALREALAGAGL